MMQDLIKCKKLAFVVFSYLKVVTDDLYQKITQKL